MLSVVVTSFCRFDLMRKNAAAIILQDALDLLKTLAGPSTESR
jgi:hypothetical protein